MSYHPLFSDDRGAADFPSVMVTVLVIAFLAGAIVLSVFKVIPWSQDSIAKHQLSTVANAQDTYRTMSGSLGPYSSDGSDFYTDSATIASQGLLKTGKNYCTTALSSGTDFVALSRSGTGKVFTLTSKNREITEHSGDFDSACLSPVYAVPVDDTTYNGETILGWASHDVVTMNAEEDQFKVRNGMLSTYVDFVNEPNFPTHYADSAAMRQAPLLIAWEPYDWEVKSTTQPTFKPTNITAGAHDAYIESWLKKAQGYAVDGTIMVRFAPEMNDAIRPWSIGTNGGNTGSQYADMWKHVYQIKERVAPDVIFMWNPLVYGSDGAGRQTTLAEAYPGKDFVDVLALDGFNWADVQTPSLNCNWQSYDDIFGGPVAELKALADGKPWGIAEVASVDKPDNFFQPGGECADSWGWVYEWPESGEHYKTPSDWITQAGWTKTMMQLAHDQGALFVNVFNYQKETDWRMNSTPEGTRVLETVRANPLFKAGDENAAKLIKAALK